MAPDRRASPADEAARSPSNCQAHQAPRGPYRLDGREYPGSGDNPGTAAWRPRQPAPVRLPPAAAAPATAVITGVLAWDEEQGDGGLLLLARGRATDRSRSIESLHKAVADARVIGMILVCEGFRRSKWRRPAGPAAAEIAAMADAGDLFRREGGTRLHLIGRLIHSRSLTRLPSRTCRSPFAQGH
jgi:hypothetical protein